MRVVGSRSSAEDPDALAARLAAQLAPEVAPTRSMAAVVVASPCSVATVTQHLVDELQLDAAVGFGSHREAFCEACDGANPRAAVMLGVEINQCVSILRDIAWILVNLKPSNRRGHGDNVASMAWNLHAIEQMQLRGRRRVDGVGRPKFDFHTGAAHPETPAGRRARWPRPQSWAASNRGARRRAGRDPASTPRGARRSGRSPSIACAACRR